MPRNRDDNNIAFPSLPPLKTFVSFNACFQAAVRNRVRNGIRKRSERSRRDVSAQGIQVRWTDDARRGGGVRHGKYAKLVEVGRKSFAYVKNGRLARKYYAGL